MLYDMTLPQITIQTPIDNEEIKRGPPQFNVIIEEENLNYSWYNFDGDPNIIFFNTFIV